MLRFFLLASIQLALLGSLHCGKLGNIELINFDELVANNYLKEGYFIFVAVNEDAKLEEPYQTELNKLKSWIDDSPGNLKIFAISDSKFKTKFSLLKFPQLIFFRNGRFIQFKGTINYVQLKNWIETNQERLSRELEDSNFEHDTQASTGSTTGDWFILFSKNDCKTSQYIESAWELASIRLENRVLFAYVDFDRNKKLQERFHLYDSPTLIFFKSGLMYRYEIKNFDVESLISFATVTYKNIKAEKVPGEVTFFDKLVDDVVKYLKKQKLEKHKNTIYICGIGFLTLVTSLFVFYKMKSSKKPTTSKSGFESKQYNKID